MQFELNKFRRDPNLIYGFFDLGEYRSTDSPIESARNSNLYYNYFTIFPLANTRKPFQHWSSAILTQQLVSSPLGYAETLAKLVYSVSSKTLIAN